jgi:hypothetical protein
VCRERACRSRWSCNPSHSAGLARDARGGRAQRGDRSARIDVTVPQRTFAAFLAERGVPALDLLPAFERAARDRDPDGFYLNNDTHWSVSGNEVAARELASSSPISSPTLR